MPNENTKRQPISSPLTGIDIGKPNLPGSVVQVEGGYNVIGGGKDIWGNHDEGYLAYQARTGDFDFLVRANAMTAADLYSKAGIMARAELSDNSPFIYFQIFTNNNPRNNNLGGYEFQYRLSKGADCKAIYPPAENQGKFPVIFPNAWIRLKREGNRFTGLYSTNGTEWQVYADFLSALPATVHLGLAVTSHNEQKTITTEFRDIGEYIG